MQTADCRPGVKCRLKTADLRGKIQTEGRMQTEDCRLGVKCRLRVECRLKTADWG